MPTKRTAQSDQERAAKSGIYEKTKRSRSFVEAWGKEFPWVVDGKDGMVCTPCMTYFGSCLKDDRASLFQTGCQNYKKESLSRHAKSQVHLKAVARAAADSVKPGSSQGDIALKMLSKSIRTKMRMLFRNAHAIAKKGRPYTNFTWMAALDEKKGLDVGQTYRSDKCCREFIDIIAEVERGKLEEEVRRAKFIAIMCDGSTDSAVIEEEMVFIRYSNSGHIQVEL